MKNPPAISHREFRPAPFFDTYDPSVFSGSVGYIDFGMQDAARVQRVLPAYIYTLLPTDKKYRVFLHLQASPAYDAGAMQLKLHSWADPQGQYSAGNGDGSLDIFAEVGFWGTTLDDLAAQILPVSLNETPFNPDGLLGIWQNIHNGGMISPDILGITQGQLSPENHLNFSGISVAILSPQTNIRPDAEDTIAITFHIVSSSERLTTDNVAYTPKGLPAQFMKAAGAGSPRGRALQQHIDYRVGAIPQPVEFSFAELRSVLANSGMLNRDTARLFEVFTGVQTPPHGRLDVEGLPQAKTVLPAPKQTSYAATQQQGVKKNLLQNFDFCTPRQKMLALLDCSDSTPGKWQLWSPQGVPSPATAQMFRDDPGSPYQWSGEKIIHIEYGAAPVSALTQKIKSRTAMVGQEAVLSGWVRTKDKMGTLYSSLSRNGDGKNLSFEEYQVTPEWTRIVVRHKVLSTEFTTPNGLTFYLGTNLGSILQHQGDWIEFAGLDLRFETVDTTPSDNWVLWTSAGQVAKNKGRIVVNTGPAPTRNALRLDWYSQDECHNTLTQSTAIGVDVARGRQISQSCWIKSSQPGSVMSYINRNTDGLAVGLKSHFITPEWQYVTMPASTATYPPGAKGITCYISSMMQNILTGPGTWVEIASPECHVEP
ncbi:hypothetical protein [Spongorhabdus nitratireducens]